MRLDYATRPNMRSGYAMRTMRICGYATRNEQYAMRYACASTKRFSVSQNNCYLKPTLNECGLPATKRRSYEDTSMTHSRGNTNAVAMTHVGNTVHKFATGAYSNVFKQVFPVGQQQKPKPSRDYTIQFSARNRKSTLHIPPTQKLSNLHKKIYPQNGVQFSDIGGWRIR